MEATQFLLLHFKLGWG